MTGMITRQSLVVSAIAGSLVAVRLLAQGPPQTIQGPELEVFLATAPVVAIKDLGKGVTIPRKATMELKGVTYSGIFKTIDQKPLVGVTRLADGTVDAEFQDSWKTEVAAYELDRLLGLGFVPATVERRYNGEVGSMQFWVTSMMDEEKRQRDHIRPPDATAWNDQMNKLFVWDNLIYNPDRNLGNILITDEWSLIAIDHSRSFRPYGKLRNQKLMVRFSRSMLARMAALTEPVLTARLGKYLTPYQVRGVLTRSGLIAAYARKLATEKGDAAVYYQ